MPQLDPSSYVSQLFWLLITFCFLWFLLGVFVMPKITDVIERRKRKIDEYVQKADALNLQAKASLERYHDTLEEAEKTSQQEIAHGKKELKEYLQNAETNLAKELNQKIADNEFTLATEKRETLQQIESMAQDLAYDIVRKLGFSKISKADIAQIALKDKFHG